MSSAPARVDVAILGSGLGGSILAAILAKAGMSVLVLEDAVHPRFTIGESLIPETGVRLRILAEKFGVPEIGWLGNFHALRDNVSSACGVKRSFSFLYHREGQAWQPGEVNQLPTLTPPFGPDSHLFRQDTDAWMMTIAMQYGARFRQQARVQRAVFGDDGVRLHLVDGEELSASFLVDAGGMRSLMATQLGLRDETPRFTTNTRTLYSHLLGVRPADVLTGAHHMPSPLGQATMHHVFDGGWMWIIPFHNHRDATNPLTSVGMMLDRRKHPTPTGAPQDEFRAIIGRYPTIQRHFADARAVRPWTASGRLQYSQQRLSGDRWIQLPHAACFVDPLYSSGLSVLTVALDLIAGQLLEAVAQDDFRQERFARVEQVVMGGFDHYDQIVSRSFDAFSSYELWNAWNRNWMLGNFLGTFGPLANLVTYLGTGDRAHLDRTTDPDRIGVLSSHLPEVRAAIQASSDDIGRAVAGELSHAEASAAIFRRLGALGFVPPYMGFGDPDQHAPATFTLPQGVRHVLWYRFSAPEKWRDYATFNLLTYGWLAAASATGSLTDAARRGLAVARDVFFADNHEWQASPHALRAHPPLQAPAAPREVAE